MTPTRRNLIIAFAVSTLAIGVLGYMLIEGWSFHDALYMTIITVTTVGFGEVHPLSASGRIFTSLLILGGVGGIFYTLTTLIQYVMEGPFQNVMRRRRMNSRIHQLTNHFIICGYGNVGAQIAREFSREKVPFAVIELDEKSVEQATSDGFLVLQGDATDEDMLKEAGVERARGLVAASGSDADNTYITLIAKELKPGILIVARANTSGSESKLRRAGADRVIDPHVIGGRRMAMLALRPLVVDFIDTVTTGRDAQLFLEDVEITDTSPLAGLTIEQGGQRLKGGFTVLAIKKKDGRLLPNPPKETFVELGDQLVVIGTRDELRYLEGMV